MKLIYTTLLALAVSLFSFELNAQLQKYSMENFTHREFPAAMSAGMKNAFSMEFEGLSNKEITKLWDDFIGTYGKAKKDKKTKESFIDNAKVPGINRGNTVDIYSKVDEITKVRSTITVWVDLGGAFLNSKDHPEDYETLKNMLLVFDKNVYKTVVQNRIKEEDTLLKSMEKDLNKLEKDTEKLHKDIEDYKSRIIKAEGQIETNNKSIEAKKEDIKIQQNNLSETEKLLHSAG